LSLTHLYPQIAWRVAKVLKLDIDRFDESKHLPMSDAIETAAFLVIKPKSEQRAARSPSQSSMSPISPKFAARVDQLSDRERAEVERFAAALKTVLERIQRSGSDLQILVPARLVVFGIPFGNPLHGHCGGVFDLYIIADLAILRDESVVRDIETIFHDTGDAEGVEMGTSATGLGSSSVDTLQSSTIRV
jgi:hypothetical protein